MEIDQVDKQTAQVLDEDLDDITEVLDRIGIHEQSAPVASKRRRRTVRGNRKRGRPLKNYFNKVNPSTIRIIQLKSMEQQLVIENYELNIKVNILVNELDKLKSTLWNVYVNQIMYDY